MTDHCTVTTLSEYIAAIEQHNLFNYISRGENKEYEHPLRSSIYRHDLDQYVRMLEQYHLDVESSISAVQERHFLAFSQHHGLPTNLLDFSYSPLVSLYFCADECATRGYVYFIRKNRFVSIGSILSKKPLGWGMFDELLNYDPDLYRVILPQMSDVYNENKEEMDAYFEKHAKDLIENYHHTNKRSRHASAESGVDDFERTFASYEAHKTSFSSMQSKGLSGSFLKSLQKIFKGDERYPSSFFSNYRKLQSTRSDHGRYSASVNVLMFLLKMEEIEACARESSDQASPVCELEFPFYFTYRPPVIDDRVRNQYSVFIFQPFSSRIVEEEKKTSVNEESHFVQTGSFSGASSSAADRLFSQRRMLQLWQKITPDFVIEVQNPKTIIRELDAIGINSKNIYCDYDSIAQYIVGSYDSNCEEINT